MRVLPLLFLPIIVEGLRSMQHMPVTVDQCNGEFKCDFENNQEICLQNDNATTSCMAVMDATSLVDNMLSEKASCQCSMVSCAGTDACAINSYLSTKKPKPAVYARTARQADFLMKSKKRVLISRLQSSRSSSFCGSYEHLRVSVTLLQTCRHTSTRCWKTESSSSTSSGTTL